MRKQKILIIGITLLLVVLVMGFIFREYLITRVFAPTPSGVERGVNSRQAKVEIVAENLKTPWSINFLPSNDLLITERSGTVQRIGENGKIFPVQGVVETGEGGLLGLALHPDFAQNNTLYLYLSTEEGGKLHNRIDQYTLENDRLSFRQTILDGIPAASNHNGGGIKFGPDKKLYVTTGDAGEPDLSQDKSSLAGKILRLNDDGSAPQDNPFNTLVWSYGHRNPQGIAWDDKDRLWSVEHGPSGFSGTGQDEINLIQKGGNYGWPEITGEATKPGMFSPVKQSGENETWAPSGLAYLDDSLYFAGLRGQALYEAEIEDKGEEIELKRHFTEEYGRLRAVAVKGEYIYFSTSNHDGRGTPHENDDKIIRVHEDQL